MDSSKEVVYLRSGMSARAYQARSQLWCDTCGRSIAAGAYFSRHRLAISGTVHNACERCRPFRIIELPIQENVLPLYDTGSAMSGEA